MSKVVEFFANEWRKSKWTTRILFVLFVVGLMTFSLTFGIISVVAGLGSLMFFLPMSLMLQVA